VYSEAQYVDPEVVDAKDRSATCKSNRSLATARRYPARKLIALRSLLVSMVVAAGLVAGLAHAEEPSPVQVPSSVQRRLYVAVPGIRNYLEYGGHGVLVFDIDRGHACMGRIATGGKDAAGTPQNVKGIAASQSLQQLFITTPTSLQAISLKIESLLWEQTYPGGCDRLSVSPDGNVAYVPSFESDHWSAIDLQTGNVIGSIEPKSGAHNTIFGPDGKSVYCAGLRSPYLTIADPLHHSVRAAVGPFGNSIRPFTIDAAQRRCYATVNELLGFEIADLVEGKLLARVEVAGFQKGSVKRHGCPSHGIALTVDQREVWLCDAHNQRIHLFDNTVMPPQYIDSIPLRDEPGWITISLDGSLAYPSTGEIIDIQQRKVIGQLTDETGTPVQSEKLMEIDFQDGKAIAIGNQFAIGRFDGTPRGTVLSSDGLQPTQGANSLEEVRKWLGPTESKPTRPMRLTLIAYEKDHGPGEHDYPAWQTAWSNLLRCVGGMHVQTAWDWPTAEQWESTDVAIVFRRGDWSAERLKQVDHHLSRGGGLVVMHWGVEGSPDYDATAARLGLASNAGQTKYRHGPIELDFSAAGDHPIAHQLPKLSLEDETYWELIGDPQRIQVLATAREDNADWPMVWTYEPEVGGRVFVAIPGHYNWTFNDPAFRLLIARGISWAGNQPVERLSQIIEK
jgi:type 1 glutamine amidotransferase